MFGFPFFVLKRSLCHYAIDRTECALFLHRSSVGKCVTTCEQWRALPVDRCPDPSFFFFFFASVKSSVTLSRKPIEGKDEWETVVTMNRRMNRTVVITVFGGHSIRVTKQQLPLSVDRDANESVIMWRRAWESVTLSLGPDHHEHPQQLERGKDQIWTEGDTEFVERQGVKSLGDCWSWLKWV